MLLRVGGVQGLGEGSLESEFPRRSETAASREDTGHGESQDSHDQSGGSKVQAWRVCGVERCVGGPPGRPGMSR